MFRFPSTTTFSKIFATIVVLSNFIRGEFDITIAGYKWIALNELYPRWMLYFFALTALGNFGTELLDCTMESLHLRNKMRKNNFPAHSGLNALLFAGIGSPNLYYSKRSYGISKMRSVKAYVSSLIITTVLYSSASFLAATQKYVSTLVVVLIICFTFISIPFIRFSASHSSAFVLNRFNKTLIGIMAEKLLEDCAQFDIRKEAFELGIGRTSSLYRLPSGACADERPNDMPCPLLHPGEQNNHFLIYGNRASVIVVEDCDPLDAAWLAFKISDYTGEELKTKYYDLGTPSYALAVSNVVHLGMGTGPWVGVEGIEHSLIWLGILLGIGKMINSILAIAYSVEPLSGTGASNTIICQWEGRNGKWDIYSDSDGIVRVREQSP